MTNDKPEREWTIELYKRYCELHTRNYELDDLWGPDEKKCSEDFSEFVDLEQFFRPIDNKQMMFDAYQALKLENEELKAEFQVERDMRRKAELDYLGAKPLYSHRNKIANLQSEVARLREQLTNAIYWQDKAKNFINHFEDCDAITNPDFENEDKECDCGMDRFAHDNHISVTISREALNHKPKGEKE